jgi:hypothetical protein
VNLPKFQTVNGWAISVSKLSEKTKLFVGSLKPILTSLAFARRKTSKLFWVTQTLTLMP